MSAVEIHYELEDNKLDIAKSWLTPLLTYLKNVFSFDYILTITNEEDNSYSIQIGIPNEVDFEYALYNFDYDNAELNKLVDDCPVKVHIGI